jgi:hypothetical protein
VRVLQALQCAPTRIGAFGLLSRHLAGVMLDLRCAAPRAPMQSKEGRELMPVILWLLGVPLGVVILLWLFHVI